MKVRFTRTLVTFFCVFFLTALFLAPLNASPINPQPAILSVPLGLPSVADWVAGPDKPNTALGDTATSAGDVNGDGYEDLLVGAFGYRTVGWNDGRVYLFLGSASGLRATPAWMVEGGYDCHNAYCNIGRGIGAAGDVNGDGYDDVIVAANRWSNGQYDEGRAFVYYGSASGLAATANWSVESNQIRAYLGWIADTAGDVNGDGYDDIIITAGDFDGNHPDEGRAFLFLGSSTGLSCGAGCPVDASAAANWQIETHQADAKLWPAGAAGDVNGDGYDDLLIGSPLYDGGAIPDAGRVWVYLGSPNGLSSTAAWSVAGGQASAQLGPGSGTAGDVNGDGYDDVLVTAHLYDNGQSDEGRVWLYLGSATGLAATPAWSAEGDQSSAYFGYSHSSRVAGDLDGDGYADAIIGAYGYDNGETNEGRIVVYLGSPAGLTATPVWSAESNQVSALFGMAAGTAGDVNGDGHDDLFAGAPGYDLGFTDSGAIFAYYSHPPTARAGGPYTVLAGATVQLDGSGSSGSMPGDTLVYNWDLDDDGIYGESGSAAVRGDETGLAPTFSAAGLQAPLAFPVKLRVTDQSGFSDGDATTVTIYDATPPLITPDVSGVLGNNGWYVSAVSVQWTVSDAESALTATTGCDPTTISTESAGITLTCSATSAGGTNSHSVTIKIDKIVPAISAAATSSPNDAGWYNSDVTVHFTCADALSGVASCPADEELSSEGSAVASTAQMVSDLAGNSSALSNVVTVQIDKTDPVVTVTGVSDGANYTLGSVPVAGCDTTDTLSGVATPATLSLTGGNADGTGAFTATCSGASDNAGNSNSASIIHTVHYNWTGFLPPVENPPTVNTVNAGQVIPIKFSLGGDYGLHILADGYPQGQIMACDSSVSGSSDTVRETVTAANSTLHYDPVTQIYTYVWNSDKAWAGTCRQLIVQLIDGVDHSALFHFHGKAHSTDDEGGGEAAPEVTPRLFLPLLNR